DEAVTSFRQAIEANPKHTAAHSGLGIALLGQGRYVEARDASARALEVLPDSHPSRAALSWQVQSAERFLKLEPRLPNLLRGEDQPGSPRESLDLATVCRHKRLFAAAARFAAAAFAADPKLANILNPAHRYYAACSASLAAAGHGKDANLG